jgi:hypothetical protein
MVRDHPGGLMHPDDKGLHRLKRVMLTFRVPPTCSHQSLPSTVEFEIGFSSEHSMIFIFDPHFMRNNPLWLVSSRIPAFAYGR